MTAHRSHRLARVLATGAIAGALAAPPALARPIDGPDEPVRPDPGIVATDPAPADAPVVVHDVDAGFDWGSAAVGAGGAGAVVVLVSLAGFALGSRRRVQAAP